MKTSRLANSGFPAAFLGALSIGALLFLGAVSAQAQPGRKLALLVGIGNYPPAGGWQTINAANDLALMSNTLQKRGFPAENILIVQEQDATREGILHAFRQHLLNQAKAGDLVYFQFSGHGQWDRRLPFRYSHPRLRPCPWHR